MQLPNYFLADLPPEATLNRNLISEACLTLKRNRERYLLGRSTSSLVQVLCELGRNWLSPDYPFRQEALRLAPAATGFSPATLNRGLNAFFRQLTPDNFTTLLEQELGNSQRLDEFAAADYDQKFQRHAKVSGPELLVHITAGNVPPPTLMSIVLGVLLRSAQFVKCASGTAWLPRLFAHSLYDLEPKLGACLEISDWRGGNSELETVLFTEADCVTAAGSDETQAAIRRRLPPRTRFAGYGHRLSFGFITHKILSSLEERRVVERAVEDIVAWNQLGCLSPHLFYVEQGRGHMAERFAEQLAAALAEREAIEPRGPIPVETAAAIATRRAFYEVRAAHSPETRHWFSPQSTAWTVIYETDPRFQISCLHRFVYVKGVADLTEALQAADPVRHSISTVGLAAVKDQEKQLATQLAQWGVPRICPLGQMQNPPLAWRHDGLPVLGGLLKWTDWEYQP